MKLLAAIAVTLSITLFACQGNKPASSAPPSDEFAAEAPAPETETDPELRRYQLSLEKWRGGIDFHASGTEPFWNLDMDFDNMTSFKALSGVEMNVPAVDGVKAMDANVTRHAADTEAGQLIVTIIEQECFNEMSGERFLHQVRVEVKGHADDGFSTFQGCGAYVPNFLLNDIWVLTHLNGEKVDDSKLAKGLPTLEFHLRDMQLRGHSGCNNLNAAISFPDREAIQFGPIAGTLMACPDSDIEDALLTALSEKRLRYQIENLRLTLSGPGGTVLVFKKVD